jgi:hypothetical protein
VKREAEEDWGRECGINLLSVSMLCPSNALWLPESRALSSAQSSMAGCTHVTMTA